MRKKTVMTEEEKRVLADIVRAARSPDSNPTQLVSDSDIMRGALLPQSVSQKHARKAPANDVRHSMEFMDARSFPAPSSFETLGHQGQRDFLKKISDAAAQEGAAIGEGQMHIVDVRGTGPQLEISDAALRKLNALNAQQAQQRKTQRA